MPLLWGCLFQDVFLGMVSASTDGGIVLELFCSGKVYLDTPRYPCFGSKFAVIFIPSIGNLSTCLREQIVSI